MGTPPGPSHGEHEATSQSTTPAEPQTFQINGNGNGSSGAVGSRRKWAIARAFARWEQMIETGITYYVKGLDGVLRHPFLTIGLAFGLLAGTLIVMWPIMRRDFFPEVDAGAFEMYVRAESGHTH